MVSSRPSCEVRASTISGWPPSWRIPTSNDSLVLGEFLSNTTGTAFPGSGGEAGAVGLVRVREVEHREQLVGGQIVVTQEMPDGLGGHGSAFLGVLGSGARGG